MRILIPIVVFACGLPQIGKALIETEFLPHLEAFLTSELAPLYASMYLTVLEAILIANIIESNNTEFDRMESDR